MIPPYHLRDHPADLVTEGPAQWLSPSLLALKGLSISRGTSHYRAPSSLFYCLQWLHLGLPLKGPWGVWFWDVMGGGVCWWSFRQVVREPGFFEVLFSWVAAMGLSQTVALARCHHLFPQNQ